MAKASKKLDKPLSKSQLVANVAEETGLTKKQAQACLDAITANLKASLGKSGPGKFVLPGLVKIENKKVPARKARKGVPNPFKPGELMDVPAKPAYTKVVVRPLKALKEMV